MNQLVRETVAGRFLSKRVYMGHRKSADSKTAAEPHHPEVFTSSGKQMQ